MARLAGEGRLLGAFGGLVLALALVAACAGAPEENTDGGRSPGGEPGEEKGEAGVEEMSVRELVGQMFVIGVGGTKPDYYVEKMIRERNIGGVLLFAHNMESEQQTRTLTGALQELSVNTEPAIPLFVAVDHEGGAVSRAPWVTRQPAAARIGARGEPGEAREVAARIGGELRRAGVNTDLAPVVDTGSGAAIGNRAYGDDPRLLARMGAAAVEGFERAGVVSAAKHFPNHGPATADSHADLPIVDHDLETLRSYDLPPFEAAVEAGVPMVMVGHLVYPTIDPGRPASLSPEAVSVLREDLGFEGVVVTDDLAMAAVSGGRPPARAAVGAVEAGADLLLISSPPQQQADAYDAVVGAVESGEIPRERVEASVERVLAVKARYPLREAGAR
ncbi:MAG TPA: glycoside hydrolase family 3 N-terminal domain-containing protein [Rubrobacteraceae bacterium]|nr:glycoside hydrolase family 3 N-terminal domain-containing protein [Rubrobacteraceae bacterium]